MSLIACNLKDADVARNVIREIKDLLKQINGTIADCDRLKKENEELRKRVNTPVKRISRIKRS